MRSVRRLTHRNLRVAPAGSFCGTFTFASIIKTRNSSLSWGRRVGLHCHGSRRRWRGLTTRAGWLVVWTPQNKRTEHTRGL
ncbi:hypothetical protein LX36DRAFT_48722 [Colletotrichum falcatum]|nr:hypothetical protein LX36DRAFT_48722 [Colletotrichum falcatum]